MSNALAPLSYAGRTPYPFGPSLYQFCVQKVKVQPAPGGGVLRLVIKIVFAVFAQGPDGRVVRCAQDRLAAFVILMLTKDGTWEPLDGDGRLLAALGAPACLNGDDVEMILLDRWIEGRPGPADPEGFNSLVDYRPITPPLLWTPSGSPPAATPGPVLETDAPPRPGARNPLRDARPLDSPPEQDDPEPDVPERALGPESPRIEPCLNAKPRWDAVLRVLTWNNKTVGAYARLAPNQAKILSSFEEEGWPKRIDDPLKRGKLRQTLKDLQKKFKDAPITFRADGTGEGILWTIR